MERASLAAFVVEAHRNGYAAGGPDVDADGRKILTYERGDWRYRDVYCGSEAFVGHEVIRRTGKPVWGMNYYGDLTGDGADPDGIYSFLRTALGQAGADRPYRGPERFENGPLAYVSSVEGDLRRFEGEERISRDETTIYRGTFAGGRVD